MNKAGIGRGLFARLRPRPALEARDAADLGTAFGLELSLQPFVDGPPAATPAGWQPPSWVQRLTARGRGSI